MDLNEPAVKAFFVLKERRNNLIHFTSSHQAIAVLSFEIEGLADTSAFDDLVPADATNALEAAEGMVCELLRLRGIPDVEIPKAVHAWTGKIPT